MGERPNAKYATDMRLVRCDRFGRRSRLDGYGLGMTAKEKLIRQVLDLGEAEAARARIVIDRAGREGVATGRVGAHG